MSVDWLIFSSSFDLNFGIFYAPFPSIVKAANIYTRWTHISKIKFVHPEKAAPIAEQEARPSCCFALSLSLVAARRPDGRRHRHTSHTFFPPIDMSDAAGAGSGQPDKRKSTRERRRPLAFDASPPVKKVKTQKLSKKDKAAAAKAKQEAAIKAALPSPSDPTAFKKAAQKPKGKLVGCALSSP